MERLAGVEGPVALGLGRVEGVLAEGIEREQAVVARVPVYGMARVGGRIENRDAEFFAVDRARIIDPVRAMTPDLIHAAFAFGVHHLTSVALLRHRIGEADREGAFLGVAEHDLLAGGSQRDVEVDDAELLSRIECRDTMLAKNRSAIWSVPIERGAQGPGFVSVPGRGLLHDDFPDAAIPGAKRRIVAPEFDAVHLVDRKRDAAMMDMILTLARVLFHRPAAGHRPTHRRGPPAGGGRCWGLPAASRGGRARGWGARPRVRPF